MKKPYIICHMAATVNGKIIGDNWGPAAGTYSGLYQQCHETFDAEAWLCGRVTMEKDFTDGAMPELETPAAPIGRIPFVADKTAGSFAIAIDPKGRLAWNTNDISGDHVIAVLTEEVSDAYLYFLQQKRISYVFAGLKDMDLSAALQQLTANFPIKTIMLEGGGHINGSFLQDGLIDELSLLILPVADSTPGTPTVFEFTGSEQPASASLSLQSVDKLEQDTVWLKYKIERS